MELIEVRAPTQQSEGTRSHLLRWLKTPGESIQKDEPLLELETEKVTVEVPAPVSGVLREVLKAPQEEIAAGELLARIDTAALALPQNTKPSVARPTVDSKREADTPGSSAHTAEAARDALFSPAVRRLLAEYQVQPGQIKGTGEGGRITFEDVERYVAAARSSHGAGTFRRIPHTPTRRLIAQRMVQSLLHTTPHVTTVFEADFSAVLVHRRHHRERFEAAGAPLTVTAYLLASCVEAIRAVPEANARWTEDALELLDEIDIGVGTAVEGKGLLLPVVRSVQTLNLLEIARELDRLVQAARSDRLTVADTRLGTFSISNHGVSGSLFAAPIVIVQPQVAILGIGKIEKRPVVVESSGHEQIAIRPRAYVTLTIDHRAMDGDRANRFLEVLVKRLESWPLD
jgi:2-oxoglutarate dehydrogenase E2 component (dihydrolipoamide succinyltransferase)